MGVKLDAQDVAEDFCGDTRESHARLAQQVRDKVVAIDAAQWLFQANSQPERQALFAQGRSEFDAMVANSVAFFTDRCLQLLRYGAHPVVVMEGAAPLAKRETLVARGKMVSAHMTGMSPQYQAASTCISRLCEAMVCALQRAALECCSVSVPVTQRRRHVDGCRQTKRRPVVH